MIEPRIIRPGIQPANKSKNRLAPYGAKWAMNVNGVGEQAVIQYSTTLDVASSFSAYIRVKLSGGNCNIMGKWDASGSKRSWLLGRASGTGRFIVSSDGVAQSLLSGNLSINNVWTDLLVVFDDSDNTQRLFVDAVIDPITQTHSGGIYQDPNVDVKFGTAQSGGWGPASGMIAETAFWNSVLLGEQARELLERKVNPIRIPGLISWWKFQEGYGVVNGTVVKDSWIENNNAILFGHSGNPSTPWTNIGVNAH
jgi:hypothetical protein